MNRRNIAFALVLFGLVGTSLGMVYWRFTNLPHPRDASHNQLLYWVVLRDLNQYDRPIQLALVDRFAGEATAIFGKKGQSGASLSPAQNERLLANIEILKRVWFEIRVDEYAGIGDPKVAEVYLKKQLQLVDEFSNLAYDNAAMLYPEKAGQELTTISDELFTDIDRWLSETPGEKEEATLRTVREATVFWLTTEDLGVHVMETRKELVSRVIAELEAGMDLQETTSFISAERGDRLKENSLLLMEAWFHLLADEYDRLPADQRNAFVDGKIASVKSWKLLDYLGQDKQATSPLAAVSLWNQTVGEWVEKADPSMKPKIGKLRAAFQQRIFFSLFRQQD
ncbi:MAG: hypothetical protein VX768_05235 [Planctomycetota bacterium]|nr:hypothetical protein [Planctomycetota bacterium]